MIANLYPDRRIEPRLRYAWDTQVFFPSDSKGLLARMVDLNSRAVALLMRRDRHLTCGQKIVLGLMYPRITDGEFDIVHHHVEATVTRSELYNADLHRVVLQFGQPLDECPGKENEYVRH
jgi:hypothetical protein